MIDRLAVAAATSADLVNNYLWFVELSVNVR